MLQVEDTGGMGRRGAYLSEKKYGRWCYAEMCSKENDGLHAEVSYIFIFASIWSRGSRKENFHLRITHLLYFPETIPSSSQKLSIFSANTPYPKLTPTVIPTLSSPPSPYL